VGISSGPALAALPDGRVYEAVSPLTSGQDANVFVPSASAAVLGEQGNHGVEASRPFEVAADGEAVVYAGEPPPTGGDGNYGIGAGNEFLGTRSPGGGWTSTDIQVPGREVEYMAFSPDLSVGVLRSSEPLTADSPPQGEDFYSHATAGGGGGENHPIYTGIPPHRLGHVQFGGAVIGGPLYTGGNNGTSVVPALSHLLFEANAALTPSAVDGGEEKDNLYDSVGGRLYLVNVLPDGKTEPNATFGAFPTYNENNSGRPGLSHVISADGSRIFWTALETTVVNGELEYRPKALYARENDTSSDARTVQVDATVGGGGLFWTASTDGSKVLFTKGDLYQYDVNSGETIDLTPGVNVQGVVGASADGGYVYYVASGYRLYLWHEGVSTFIATLSPEDGGEKASGVSPFGNGGGFGHAGAWQAAVGYHTAEVTPDGHSLVFMSNQSLTGYDNEEKGTRLFEVFLYEAGAGKITCVSCNPKGEPPVPTEFDSHAPGYGVGGFLPISKEATYQPQSISSDGSRVFFNSGQPLVPQDINGWLDVYEWERDGTGSCRESHGCVYLLSGGIDPESSYLLGASANGNDAFIISRAQLLPQGRGDNDVVYDARVGGVQPPAVTACSGTGCQGVPPAPPIFATPSSVTFDGIGNFPPLSRGQAKHKAKSLTTVQKLASALKACRAKHNPRKRSVCEANTRKRYGAKSRAKKSNRRYK
jgi:hypothetical protein